MNRLLICTMLLVTSQTTATTVCSSGCDYSSIGAGILNTPEGGTVVVKEGVYGESNLTLGGSGRAHILLSEKPNQPELVVIDGGENGQIIRLFNDAQIIGMTLTNGSSNNGGAIGVSGPDVVLQRCVIRDNVATDDGGALFLGTGGASVVIDDCLFRNNRAEAGGALAMGGGASAVIRNSRFEDNRAWRGGAISTGMPTVIENSRFSGNVARSSKAWGGAILLGGDAFVVHHLENVSLMGNRASTFDTQFAQALGGGLYMSSNPTVFVSGLSAIGNSVSTTGSEAGAALQGGGVYVRAPGSGRPKSLVGVAVSQNHAAQGGGIYCAGEELLTLSGTVSGNTEDDILGCQQCTAGETRDCETGLAGMCAIGTQQCRADGTYGACTYSDNSLSLAGFLEGESDTCTTGAKGDSCNRCADGLDNDCDGKVDLDDSGCNAPKPTTANAAQSTSAGDPVNTLLGELWQRFEPDLELGGPLALRFERYYASALEANGVTSTLGSNWRHNFDWSAAMAGDGLSVTVLSNEGRQIRFIDDGGAWVLDGAQDIPFQLATDATTSELVLGDPRTRLLYAFDPATGRLNTIQDGNLNTLALSYTGADLAMVSDGHGRSLSFAYAGGLLASVSDDGGRSVSFGHTGSDLVSVTDLRGNTTTLSYDPGSLMSAMTRPRGNTPLTQVWGAMDQVSSQTDAESNTLTLAYGSPLAGDTTVTHPGADATVHTHSQAGALINLEDAAGLDIAVANDAQGRRGALVDRRGDPAVQEYDSVSGQPDRRIRADGTERRFGYSSFVVRGIEFRRLASILHPYGALESFGYDGAGNLVRVTDAEGNTTRLTRNGQGLVTAIVNALDATTTFTYNPDGTRASATDAAMNTTTFGYDARRRLNEVSFADGTTRTFTYDAGDKLLTETDGRTNTTTNTYDANGNLATVTDRTGQVTSYAYDDLDRLTAVTDASGTFAVSYDERGRVASISDENANTTTYGYDSLERLVAITDATGQATTVDYDAEGLVSALIDPLSQRTEVQTDPLGRVIGRSSPLMNETAFDYDPLTRKTTVVNAEGELRSTRYTLRGQLDGIDVGPLSTELTRDVLGNVTTLTTPGGSDWLSSHDGQGRVVSTSDPLGNTTTLTYDNRNRPDIVTFPGTVGSVDFDHDANGNLIQAAYSDGTTLTATYDAEDRLIGGTNLTLGRDAVGRIVESNGVLFTRDAAGRLEAVIYAPGKAVVYAYNGRDQVTSIDDWLGNTTTLTYDAAGRLVDIIRPNGIHTSQSWDAEGRLASLAHGDIVAIAISRDGVGRPTEITRLQPALPNASAVGERSASYDAADRIEGFVYDAAGRLLSDGMRSFSWSASGQLETFDQGTGTIELSGDLFGNLTQIKDASGTTDFVLGYGDGANGRVLIERHDGSDAFYHILLGTLTLYTIDASDQALQFNRDENGHVVAMTDAGGAVLFSAAYSPTGQRTDGVTSAAENGRPVSKGDATDLPRGSRLNAGDAAAGGTIIGDDLYLFSNHDFSSFPQVYDTFIAHIISEREVTPEPVDAGGVGRTNEAQPPIAPFTIPFFDLHIAPEECVEPEASKKLLPESSDDRRNFLLTKRRKLVEQIGDLEREGRSIHSSGGQDGGLLRAAAITGFGAFVVPENIDADPYFLSEKDQDRLNELDNKLRPLWDRLDLIEEDLKTIDHSIIPELTPFVTLC